MKCEILASEKAQLCITSLQELKDESNVIDYGAIILCKGGTASMRIDFKDWHLKQYAVITLFPYDVVMLHDVSDDFEVEMLRYDKTLLREASLQLEQTVYSLLRKDRCRTDKQVVTLIIENMFSLLRLYFIQKECMCLDQLVLYQLKAFFLGFYDWMVRNRHEAPEDNGSRRTNELFNMFMEDLEQNYMKSHTVAFYAGRLNITSKYLNNIVRQMTGYTTKDIIDQYVTMQIKLQLRTADKSVKQLAWDFNFSDESFFCRYFKLHTGYTPQQFRKNIKQQ